MPKMTLPLTDTEIKTAKPGATLKKLRDGKGLLIEIHSKESKRWRFRYVFNGKEKEISLGLYPDVGLARARELRDELRELVARGIDPSEKRKEEKEAKRVEEEQSIVAVKNSLENVARKWLEHLESTEISDGQVFRITRSMENHLFPWLGRKDISTIQPRELLEIVKRVESGGKFESAKRLFQNCGRIWKYAVTHGHADRNITADIDSKLAIKGGREANFPHITDPIELAECLRAIDGYTGDFITRIALQITPYLFMRPFNIRAMEWKELDLERREWSIPAQKMKKKRAFICPIPEQVDVLLDEIRALTGEGCYVFPSARGDDRSMSEATATAALSRMGYKNIQTAHGFRHTASTLLHEHQREHGVPPHVIEFQLAHVVHGVAGVYNKAQYLDERRELMQWWADYLDELKKAQG